MNDAANGGLAGYAQHQQARAAKRSAKSAAAPAVVSLDDFFAYMPQGLFIFAPTRQLWPGSSVNARIPPLKVGTDANGDPIHIKASAWLAKRQPVEQMTWHPGEPMLIKDRLIAEGGFIEHTGATVFNLYRAPTLAPGDPRQAARWLAHVRRVYPDDAEHILKWLAHRVQRPTEKLNHALVLGGAPGIGKDTILHPVVAAIGPWNFEEVTPQQLLGRFNGFVKSVILRINEARDLGEFNRYAFYEHTKPLIAAPPETLRVDEKQIKEYRVPNLCGIVITTNYKTDGIFLPPDDRRHYVAWSDLAESDFDDAYFPNLYAWFDAGGSAHVAAWLAAYDLAEFDAKQPPPKTAAFWAIATANRPPQEAELADIIDRLTVPPKAQPQSGEPPPAAEPPDILTLEDVAAIADDIDSTFADWLRDRGHRRIISGLFERVGYEPVDNPYAADKLWKIKGKRQRLYSRRSLPPQARIKAAQKRAR